MKPIGVIGAIGPESTIDYYRAMIAAYRERHADGSYPAIVINSIDADALLGLLSAHELAKVADDVAQMTARDGIDAVILGGTELPLILRDTTASGIPLLDTTQIHAKAIVARAML